MKRKRTILTDDQILLKDLKEFMENECLTQIETSRKIGISYVTINRWMNGHTRMLSNLTRKAVVEFIEGEGK